MPEGSQWQYEIKLDGYRAIRERLEGCAIVVAKPQGLQPTKRSDAWVKVRANLVYAGSVQAGFVPDSKQSLLSELTRLHTVRCPFANVPDRTCGRWGEGITAERMQQCRWVKPERLATVDFIEWTPDGRLRPPRFVQCTPVLTLRKPRDH